MKTYKIEFNDWGVAYLLAEDFAQAFHKFSAIKKGGEEVIIKVITYVCEGII